MLSSFIDKKTSFPLAAFMSLCREEVIEITSYFIFAAMVQPCLVCCVHSVEPGSPSCAWRGNAGKTL